MFALKALSHEGVESALAKAEHYRLLSEPAEAESICRDILEIEPGNQRALICFVLAESDQIARDSRAFQSAITAAARLAAEHGRAPAAAKVDPAFLPALRAALAARVFLCGCSATVSARRTSPAGSISAICWPA